jgi:hypothetical protein
MNKSLTILTLMTVAAALSGCQATKWSKTGVQNLNPLKHVSADKEAAPKNSFAEPVRMAVIWSDGVYDAVGKPKVSGFGARIYFYNEAGDPVQTDGELTVYGYDDDKQQGGKSADRKFVFRQSEFQSHFSETGLGKSYSFWIPWEKSGGPRKSVSLIPVFKSSTGKVLQGDQSVNVLPGTDPETNEVISSEIKISKDVIQLGYQGCFQNQVATAGYEQDVANPAGKPTNTGRLKRPSTTISVPKSMASRLAVGPELVSFPNRPQQTPTKTDEQEKTTRENRPPQPTAPAPTTESESRPFRTFGLPGH